MKPIQTHVSEGRRPCWSINLSALRTQQVKFSHCSELVSIKQSSFCSCLWDEAKRVRSTWFTLHPGEWSDFYPESKASLEQLIPSAVHDSTGWRLAGHRDLDLLWWQFLLCSSSRDIDVWVVVNLVTLSQVLNNVKVGPGRFCQAVFQNPTIWFRLWITQPENVLHGRLQITDTCQNQQLVKKGNTVCLIKFRLQSQWRPQCDQKYCDCVPPSCDLPAFNMVAFKTLKLLSVKSAIRALVCYGDLDWMGSSWHFWSHLL